MKKVLNIFICILIVGCSADDFEEIEQLESDVFILPVVIHIIHIGEAIGEGANLSKERILQQIESLNNDYRRKEGTRGYNTHALGADTKIEFRLAEIDPFNQKTDGINRIDANDVTIDSDLNDLPFDWLPQYAYWNPEKYINIWVLPAGPQDLFLGSAQFPYTGIPGLDNEVNTVGTGLFINTLHFGESDIISDINLGRTLTHEMGHFLGLEHLWGKYESADCMEYDDYVNDTPPVGHRNNECNGEELSCHGEPILKQNYMDYLPDACMNMFTEGQASRMAYVLENSVDRKSLTSSDVISRH